MAAAKSGFYYPNKMVRIYLTAIEEMVSPEAMKTVLNLADLPQFIEAYPPNNMGREVDFADFSAIGAALEKMYGARGERGLGLHASKATFNQGVADLGSLTGVGELAFKAISPNAKLKIGLKAMAESFNKFSDQVTVVEEASDRFVYTIQRCPVCWGRTSSRPICYIAGGIIGAGLRWLSEGHYFEVDEVACCATGDKSCVFHIKKETLS
ncbi:MAG TPA: V4R domain-containing protein [Anaerolineae bacterium]|nr:V4R domain-containing protein [Anaerolineae bacterium]